MTNYNEIYTSKYGENAKMILRDLGGDPDAIITNYPATVDWPFGSMIAGDLQDDADSIHGLIVSEIEHLYFSTIPRSSAVAICNTLSLGLGFGTIRISSSIDLEYNSYTFMQRWNDNHPDEGKIIPPAALEI